MPPSFGVSHRILCLSTILLLTVIKTPADANTTFVQSRAAYYPDSDNQGTLSGACEFGSFGATINGGDVSAVSDLYRDGVGCGACYQVRCTKNYYCTENGVNVIITDKGWGHQTDFILSRHAFKKLGQSSAAAESLLALGVVDIQYKRVSCSYPNKNMTIMIDKSSSNPHYLAFVIWYQQGDKDIVAVQLCEQKGIDRVNMQTQTLECKLMIRSHGAVWAMTSPPSGALSIRMLLQGTDEGDTSWLVSVNDIPRDWMAGRVYDSGVQVDA